MFYKMIPHLMGFVLICITIRGHEHEFSQIFLKFLIALKYKFHHILLKISTCDLELFRKLPIPMGNIIYMFEMITRWTHSPTIWVLVWTWVCIMLGMDPFSNHQRFEFLVRTWIILIIMLYKHMNYKTAWHQDYQIWFQNFLFHE